MSIAKLPKLLPNVVVTRDAEEEWNLMRCEVCEDTGWVCENHPDRPSDCGGSTSKRVCGCGAGMPCLLCNTPKLGG